MQGSPIDSRAYRGIQSASSSSCRQVAITVVLLVTSIALLLYCRNVSHLKESGEVSKVFWYEGNVRQGDVFLVHLVIRVDVLVRLIPLKADPDLFVATGQNGKTLIERLPRIHRSQCTINNPVHPINTSWNQLLNTSDINDIYRLFTHQSASLGIEELEIKLTDPSPSTLRTPVRQPAAPILVAVRPYADTSDSCDFRLEVLPHQSTHVGFDDIRRAADQAGLSYEQLSQRFATIPREFATDDATRGQPVVVDRPDRTTRTEPTTFVGRIAHTFSCLEPLFFTVVELLFDAIM